MRASLAFNRPLSLAYLHLGLSAPGFPATFRAGEFVMLRPSGVEDPFLPRAFSIYRISGGGSDPGSAAAVPIVEILYKIVGKGTQGLSRMGPGDAVEILGPLGNAFRRPAGMTTAVLVAGGIGVPPISALATELGTGHGARGTGHGRESRSQGPGIGDRGAEDRGRGPGVRGQGQETGGQGSGVRDRGLESRGQGTGVGGQGEGLAPPETASEAKVLAAPRPLPPGPRLEVFLGGRTSEDILCVADFQATGGSVHVATEDGTLGARGLVTDLLQPFLARQGASGTQIYACGPAGMLEAVGRLAEALEIPCQLSLEANMACGFGACMGCAVPMRGPEPRYKLCCKDGPVFEASEVAWG